MPVVSKAFRKRVEQGKFFVSLRSFYGPNIQPFSCARSAVVMGLRTLGVSRMEEILVPPFMCQAVLSALSRTSFPVMGPSHRTRAILVFHQFGYPQDLSILEPIIQKNNWVVVNDCAHTLFSRYKGKEVLRWGDFTIVSFSKLYPCFLGGALISFRKDLMVKIKENCKYVNRQDINYAKKAFMAMEQAQKDLSREENLYDIAGVYGYLPEVLSFPRKALSYLPLTKLGIENDTLRRKNIWNIVRKLLPRRVPVCPECEVVPWAVPVKGALAELNRAIFIIKKKIGVTLSILHFDFARNLLQPNYQPALIIECSSALAEKQILEICEELITLGF